MNNHNQEIIEVYKIENCWLKGTGWLTLLETKVKRMKEAVYSHSINNMLTELQPHRRFYILLRYLHLIHRRKF